MLHIICYDVHNMTHTDIARPLDTEVSLNLWALGKSQLSSVSVDSRGNENLKAFRPFTEKNKSNDLCGQEVTCYLIMLLFFGFTLQA